MFVETHTILIRVPIDKINICKSTLFLGVAHKPRIEYGYLRNAFDVAYDQNNAWHQFTKVYRILKWRNAYTHVQFLFFEKLPLYCLRGNLFRVYVISEETLGVERAFSVFF